MICKTEGCSVPLSTTSKAKGGHCLKCRKAMHHEAHHGKSGAAYAIERAQAVPPSLRNREDWVALRDHASGMIKCRLAQNESIDAAGILYKQAQQALAVQPVTVCPLELARLQRIEKEAHDLVDVLSHVGVPDPREHGERTLPYYARMFRGMNLTGCFRGRY